jgi:hypothetical protein
MAKHVSRCLPQLCLNSRIGISNFPFCLQYLRPTATPPEATRETTNRYPRSSDRREQPRVPPNRPRRRASAPSYAVAGKPLSSAAIADRVPSSDRFPASSADSPHPSCPAHAVLDVVLLLMCSFLLPSWGSFSVAGLPNHTGDRKFVLLSC